MLSISAVGQSPSNPISMLRANDSFDFVKTDSIKKGFNKLKHIPLSKRVNISFGGDLREQFQYFENINFGDVPPSFVQSSVGQLWHRAMLHSNIGMGEKLRVFVQVNSTFRLFNPNPFTPEIDQEKFGLHQAFIEYTFHKNWSLRAGRQEMSYGNNRIITFREGPNNRLAFDAAVLKYRANSRKVDVLAISPVISKTEVFDNTSLNNFVYGVYGTEYFITNKLLMDYYVLNFQSSSRVYNHVGGDENRQSYGLRFFSDNPKLNYELEATYQSGRFNDLRINAYGFSSDLSYKLHQKYKLVLGIGANYISGDKDQNDAELNTYNLIYSKPSYGLAAPIGSSNIVNLNPYVKINPTKKMSIWAGVYFLSRQSVQDGTYTQGMTQIRPTPNLMFASIEKSIGTQYSLETGYQLNQHIFFAIDAAYFVAGDYVVETGKGLNSTYVSFKGSFKF